MTQRRHRVARRCSTPAGRRGTGRPVQQRPDARATADVAVYLDGRRAAAGPTSTRTRCAASATVATEPRRLRQHDRGAHPRRRARRAPRPRVAVAAGLADGGKLKTLGLQPNVANVAFRTDRAGARLVGQAAGPRPLPRHDRPRSSRRADLGRMAARRVRALRRRDPATTTASSAPTRASPRSGEDGILQHYGVYLPESYRAGEPSPVQWWFHFRGGNAHIAAAVVPGIFRDMGEAHDSVVVTPDGRGERGWYVGQAATSTTSRSTATSTGC